MAPVNPSLSKPDLIARLDRAKAKHAGSRTRRLLHQPVKSLLPVAMRKAGIERHVNVPTFWGGTFSGVLPEAVTTQIWRRTYFDEPVCRTLIQVLEPGMTFVDVGAHLGFFSLFASQLVGESGKVLSIEAMPSTFRYLQENTQRNRPFDNIVLHQGAAFDAAKQLEFSDFGITASSLNTAFSSRGQKGLAKKGKKVLIDALPADLIINNHRLEAVDLIKIDAECSEQYVLKGLTQTIERCRPVIVMEVGDIESDGAAHTSDLIARLSDLGYQAFEWKGSDLLPFKPQGPVPYANLVFRHPETR